jgi:hypothetical protein
MDVRTGVRYCSLVCGRNGRLASWWRRQAMNCWIEQLKAAKHSLSMRRDAWNLSMRRARAEPARTGWVDQQVIRAAGELHMMPGHPDHARASQNATYRQVGRSGETASPSHDVAQPALRTPPPPAPNANLCVRKGVRYCAPVCGRSGAAEVLRTQRRREVRSPRSPRRRTGRTDSADRADWRATEPGWSRPLRPTS